MKRHKHPPIAHDDAEPEVDVQSLTNDELLASLRNDQAAYADAGRVNIPAALTELRERTARGEGPSAQALAEADGTIAAGAIDAGQPVELDDAGKVRAVPEPEPTAEPDPLTAAGFMALRSQVMGGASAIESVSPELLDRLLKFAEDSRRRAKLRGAARPQLDAVDADVEVLSALIRFRQELKRIGENAAARAAIVGPAR